MITKTYLDGKLNGLEEKLKRRIDLKDDRQAAEINEDIRNLKDAVKLLEEKVSENRDIMDNYLQEHNDIKNKLAELKSRIGNFEKIVIDKADIKTAPENDTIISDI